MSKFKHDLLLRLIKLVDAVLMTIPFALCWYLYYSDRTASPFDQKGNLIVVLLFLVLFIIFGRIYDAFMMSIQQISEIVYAQFLAVAVSDLIIYVVICLLSKGLTNLLPGIAALVGQIILAFLWAYLAHHGYYATFPAKRTAIIYDVRRGFEKLIGKYGLDGKYDVVLTLSAEDCLKDLSVLDGIETVFASGIHSHDRNIILKYCIEHSINMFVIPRIGDVIMSGTRHMHMFHLPMLTVSRYMASPEYLLAKRIIDIIVSALGLIVLSPILLVTAIAIKATDHGPVFYKQVRLTKNGREFNIFKFRSMCVDAEKDGVARLSTGDKGDLSIVGPRPERPEIAAQYCEEMPEFNLRLQAKAGLTGYAQVYGKYNTTPYDKLVMDLMYIAHPSIIVDFKIMFATVKILFLPESTEGVAEGQATTMAENEVTVAAEKKAKNDDDVAV